MGIFKNSSEWASESWFRCELGESAKQGNPQKARKFHLAVAEKRNLLEAVSHPSGKVAFVDEMGKPKLILA